MSIKREMSLVEWCAKLPSLHLVNQELSTLNTQLAAKDADNKWLRSAVTLQAEQLAALAEQNKKLREALIDTAYFLEQHSNRWDGIKGKHPNDVVEAARNALSSPDLASPVLNSIPKEPTLPVFDADSPRFRQVFDEAVQAHNLPGKRKGEGYRSPITQWCFEIAYSVVNRLRLYEK